MSSHKAHEYVNDYFYFVVRPKKEEGEKTLLYCSGVNVSRFSPITKGRHGIGSNPSVRGLQLVNHGVRALALSRGATPKALRGKDCAGLIPTEDTWYTELLLIEDAVESFPDEMIEYCVISLLRKIFNACMLEVPLPENLPGPHELQVFLDAQCRDIAGQSA
ncbi:MAG TPA: hypothetical protein VMH06_05545 [Thermodesulfovibrionales bacterium]|nr:hypothetical protein [Thermodesulfovibrionales bacterium]